MRASEAIKELQNIIKQHGDLPIVGGYLADDTPLKKFTVLDDEGCEVGLYRTKPESIFLEG